MLILGISIQHISLFFQSRYFLKNPALWGHIPPGAAEALRTTIINQNQTPCHISRSSRNEIEIIQRILDAAAA
jgi:hypothetical protein